MPETESVTILFTDLVGSTELSYSLAPDAADEVRRAHFSTLREAIAGNGGTEVKNLGDGIMVAFPASSPALACAVAMQQAVELHNRGGNHELGLRVGISGGEVTREAEDFFGDPVIEAARLCARAEGGQILASQFVQLMAGRRTPHVFRLIGELELKGLSEPIDTVEVSWEPLAQSPTRDAVDLDTPLPPSLAALPDIGRVLGRDEPHEALIQAYKRVEAGEGREVVLVCGEPGVGKSTLVASLARRAKDLGACVLYGHYDEGVTLSYQGFAEALGHYVNNASDELLRAHVAADGPELAVMVPAIGRRIGDLSESHEGDPDTMRFMLFASVVGWLAKASVHAPVVIVLEDLHWADTQSLQLLRHLVGSSDALRLLVLVTYRDEIGPSHPLTQTLASMRREPRVVQMSLAGLDEAGVLDFLETALASRLDDEGAEFASALRQETEGNPFFVSELLRHLLETNAICDGEGRLDIRGSLSDMSLPQSVRQVIAARVDRLGSTAVRVLSLASVIGRDFEFEVLASAAGVPEDELLDLFDEAEASALVAELDDEPGRYRFAHALIAHTLADDLGPTRRSRAHRRVAIAYEALLAQDLGVEEIEDHHISRLQVSNSRRRGNRLRRLAHHYASTADPRDRPRALAYCQKAGEAALQALAPDEAREWFRRAVEMHEEVDHGDPLRGVDLSIGLGTAQRHAGEAANRQTLLGAARQAQELGEAERLTRAILTACDGGLSAALGYLDEEKVARLEGALALAGEADSPTRAILLARLCSELTFGAPLERRAELADQARSMARRLGDPAILLEVLNTIQYTLDVPETLEDRLQETAQAVELSERVGNPALSFWAAWLRSVATMQAGLPAELEESMQVMERLKELRWLSRRPGDDPHSPEHPKDAPRRCRRCRARRSRGTGDRHRQGPGGRVVHLRRAGDRGPMGAGPTLRTGGPRGAHGRGKSGRARLPCGAGPRPLRVGPCRRGRPLAGRHGRRPILVGDPGHRMARGVACLRRGGDPAPAPSGGRGSPGTSRAVALAGGGQSSRGERDQRALPGRSRERPRTAGRRGSALRRGDSDQREDECAVLWGSHRARVGQASRDTRATGRSRSGPAPVGRGASDRPRQRLRGGRHKGGVGQGAAGTARSRGRRNCTARVRRRPPKS